jgi:integrase
VGGLSDGRSPTAICPAPCPLRSASSRRRGWGISTRAACVARARSRLEDAAGPLGRAAGGSVRGPVGALAGARGSRPRAAAVRRRTADRLRTALGRACRDAGVPRFNVHSLRHRRVSLLHRQGVDWVTIGARGGQRSRLVTADRCSHALVDAREVDQAKLLRTCTCGAAPVRTSV